MYTYLHEDEFVDDSKTCRCTSEVQIPPRKSIPCLLPTQEYLCCEFSEKGNSILLIEKNYQHVKYILDECENICSILNTARPTQLIMFMHYTTILLISSKFCLPETPPTLKTLVLHRYTSITHFLNQNDPWIENVPNCSVHSSYYEWGREEVQVQTSRL